MKINKILVVGGGSAGWMTAATLIKSFPKKQITLIESPNIKTVGVGESTIGGIKNWTKYLDIKDDEFFKATDATYKLSIRFENFYNKKDGGFHYPFGSANLDGNYAKLNDWIFKKHLYPKTHRSNFAECMYPQMALVNENKLFDNNNNEIPFDFKRDTAYHFDATKFGLFLRDKYCLPKGVKHIKENIDSIQTNEKGIKSLNNKHTADLFIDCTGFRSLLLDKTLKEPFESYQDILPNNSAWATRVPYSNKRKQLNGYTNCEAMSAGWIWTIPLWSRIGTGYVYSVKYISDEDALKEFKNHIGQEDLKFNKIKMRVGIQKRLWVKNVVAIGLSAGFIEPLESNGLFSVHEFLIRLVRNMQRDKITQWDKDNFTFQCKTVFRNFAEFVALHYALSNRDDTKYWKDISNKTWEESLINLKPLLKNGFLKAAIDRNYVYHYDHLFGLPCIAFGMDWYPTEVSTIKYYSQLNEKEFKKKYLPIVQRLDKKVFTWKKAIKNKTSIYDYHKQKFYA